MDLPASRELLLTQAVRDRARQLKDEFPGIRGMLEKMAEGIPAEGMESLIPALVDDIVTVVDYLPEGSAIALVDPERAVTRAITLLETNREFLEAAWSAATAGAASPVDIGSGDFVSLPALREAAGQHGIAWWTLSAFDSGEADASAEGLLEVAAGSAIRVPGSSVPSFQGNVDGATAHVGELLAAGWRVVVAASGTGLVERARDVMAERGIAARRVDEVLVPPEPGVAHVVLSELERGFEAADAKLAVLTETEFYGRTIGGDQRLVKKLASRRRNVVDPLQLKTGDFVVHATHGIGRFVELTQREVSSGGRNPVKSVREYLVLEYAPSKRGYPGDKLYVPTDQLDLLSKYVGGEAPDPLEDGRQRLGAGQGPRAAGGARYRGGARQALLGAHGGQGSRVRTRHPLAARARGGVPVRRDARPAADDR